MIFVDASAIVAILTREPEAGSLAEAIRATAEVVTSPIAVYEAVLAIRRKHVSSVGTAQRDVSDFLRIARVRVLDIAADLGLEAIETFARFGRGQGHPARLNMGDCFAYAITKRLDARILFVGEDFTHTDLAPAVGPRQ